MNANEKALRDRIADALADDLGEDPSDRLVNAVCDALAAAPAPAVEREAVDGMRCTECKTVGTVYFECQACSHGNYPPAEAREPVGDVEALRRELLDEATRHRGSNYADDLRNLLERAAATLAQPRDTPRDPEDNLTLLESLADAALAEAREPVGDEQIIETCKAAGLVWLEPDTDPDEGFPGAFDLTSIEQMRRLFTALAQPRDTPRDSGDAWIACSERLPDVGKLVIVCNEGEESSRVHWRRDMRYHKNPDKVSHWMRANGMVGRTPTHWRPLPAPMQSPTGEPSDG